MKKSSYFLFGNLQKKKQQFLEIDYIFNVRIFIATGNGKLKMKE